MERYSHDRPCSKCGQHDIHNRYVKKGERIDPAIGDPFARASKPLIRRSCRNCGFKWSELPVNKQDQ